MKRFSYNMWINAAYKFCEANETRHGNVCNYTHLIFLLVWEKLFHYLIWGHQGKCSDPFYKRNGRVILDFQLQNFDYTGQKIYFSSKTIQNFNKFYGGSMSLTRSCLHIFHIPRSFPVAIRWNFGEIQPFTKCGCINFRCIFIFEKIILPQMHKHVADRNAFLYTNFLNSVA